MSDKRLEIALEDVNCPALYLWKWSREDYKVPVRVQVDGAEVQFRFIGENAFNKSKALPNRQAPLRCSLLVRVDHPSADFVDGLVRPSGAHAQAAAEQIYSFYNETLNKIVLCARWAVKPGGIIFEVSRTSFQELFTDQGLHWQPHANWRLGSGQWTCFQLAEKGRRGRINPMFKSRNLITPAKWRSIDAYSASGLELTKEVEELVRIRAQVAWGQKRIPVVETAALVEVAVRNKVAAILRRRGQSERTISNTSDGVGLSILLNVMLPFLLNKSEMRRYKRHLDALDALRRTRNEIMHRNISEAKIDLAAVKRGVEAAIQIVRLLDRKKGVESA